jgi:uncharacterized protein YeaO (DUF488 family)
MSPLPKKTAPTLIDETKQTLKTGNLTLVYADRDETRNNTQVLKSWRKQKLNQKLGVL